MKPHWTHIALALAAALLLAACGSKADTAPEQADAATEQADTDAGLTIDAAALLRANAERFANWKKFD